MEEGTKADRLMDDSDGVPMLVDGRGQGLSWRWHWSRCRCWSWGWSWTGPAAPLVRLSSGKFPQGEKYGERLKGVQACHCDGVRQLVIIESLREETAWRESVKGYM